MRMCAAMKLDSKASVEIGRPREQVFDIAVDAKKLPAIMKRVGPIPGVSSVDMEGELRAGARRKANMSDGSVMGEEITVLERPRAYAYRWLNKPAAPFSLLVRGADSDWNFAETPGGSRVDWTYTFELTSPLAAPLAWAAIQLFGRWMRAALGELKAAAEGASA